MIKEDQMPEDIRKIIREQVEVFGDKNTITDRNEVPDTCDIPLNNKRNWLKIRDVICVYSDMKGSTKLSKELDAYDLASAYQLFTETIIRIFHALNASYVDVKGDGVFALFNSDEPHLALVSAVAAKTFVFEVFMDKFRIYEDIIGSHFGIDVETLLVRRFGLKRVGGRTDRQNEVWAGKTVNMASKLASISGHNQIVVSDRFYHRLNEREATWSCGCPNGEETQLWESFSVDGYDYFDFSEAYLLKSNWCPTHGEEFFNKLRSVDS